MEAHETGKLQLPSLQQHTGRNGYNVHACFRRKMADCMYGRIMEGVLDLCNRVVSGKNPQIFSPSLPAEYVTAFSGRTDTP